jgi:hypothetical protein
MQYQLLFLLLCGLTWAGVKFARVEVVQLWVKVGGLVVALVALWNFIT